MKVILLSLFMLMFSGCNKVSEWVSTPAEPDATGGVPYDTQNEVKLIVPWDWVVFDVKNAKKKSANADPYIDHAVVSNLTTEANGVVKIQD